MHSLFTRLIRIPGGHYRVVDSLRFSKGLTQLGGFVSAIGKHDANWMDDTQTRVPGYRDRVARVRLDDSKEGGINLNMPRELIRDLGARGRGAALGGSLIALNPTPPRSLQPRDRNA